MSEFSSAAATEMSDMQLVPPTASIAFVWSAAKPLPCQMHWAGHGPTPPSCGQKPTPTFSYEQKSLTEMQRLLTEMNRLLERVGNLSEKYSSKWIDWLPDFSLLVALKWVMLVLILGTAALAGWYGAAAIRGLFL